MEVFGSIEINIFGINRGGVEEFFSVRVYVVYYFRYGVGFGGVSI